MDVITEAIIVALANLGKDVIKNSYNALKSAIKEKFGSDSDVVNAVEGLEKKPDSEGRKVTLKEEIQNSKVNEDPEIHQLAQDILDKVEEKAQAQQNIHQTISNPKNSSISGSGNASIGSITEHNVSDNQ
ncbi:MAG: hypothetical protein F6K49_07885 [Moorea sp. SIO3I6]|nr:hypothetical protein [Moorena sp. SIO3I6]